ncbi:MAG: microcystin-dependent protein, partial [Candidatus Krumholzibacteriia bacterium]
FAPTGWATCDGQLLPIAQNNALFSLLGTFYGGDGRTTFALPGLNGRTPIHQGSGAGLSPRLMGGEFGLEVTELTGLNMPAHSHTGSIVSSTVEGDRTDPTGAFLARPEEPVQPYSGIGGGSLNNASLQIDAYGGGLPVGNMQPSLVLNFVIALVGIYPSRD